MSQSCLCCSSFIPRLFHYTNMDVFLGLSIEKESYCFTFMLYNQQQFHCLVFLLLQWPHLYLLFHTPPLLILNLAVPLLALNPLLLFRFFFSCAQPQNLLRLGEGISRLSRAAHQCVLCSFWNYRSLAPRIKALSLVWYSSRSTSYGHPIASSKRPIRLKSNRKRQWCSLSVNWNWSNQGVEWWSLSYELQQTNYSAAWYIKKTHWWMEKRCDACRRMT